jgi:hypothetical protein
MCSLVCSPTCSRPGGEHTAFYWETRGRAQLKYCRGVQACSLRRYSIKIFKGKQMREHTGQDFWKLGEEITVVGKCVVDRGQPELRRHTRSGQEFYRGVGGGTGFS